MLIGLYMLLWLPIRVGMLLFYQWQGIPGESPAATWLDILVNSLLGVIAIGAAIQVCEGEWTDQPAGFWRAAGSGFRNALRMIFGQLMVSLILIAAFIALLFPGIWLSVRLAFVFSIIIAERRSARAAISRSLQLTSNHFWPLLGYYLLGVLPWIGFYVVLAIGYTLLMEAAPVIEGYVNLGAEAVGVVAEIYMLVFGFVLYKHRAVDFEKEQRARRVEPVSNPGGPAPGSYPQ
jgi:hypothetical protein